MFKTLRRLAFVPAAIVFLLCAGAFQSARADAFTFVTSGVFNNIPLTSGCIGNGTNEINCTDGRRIVFNGSSFSQDFNGSNYISTYNSLGTFQYFNVPPSSAVGPPLPDGITFTLNISQFGPTLESGALTAVIRVSHEGMYDYNIFTFDSHLLQFQQSSFAVGNFYVPYINYIPSQATAFANVPEPATMLLLSTGLTGLGLAARVRRKFKRREQSRRNLNSG